ncbi:hypothetical protein BC793_11136 [Actinoplanes xinjiangensis]|uniref:Uncharacterized protein n=1 Tax=Actinoplanes xinjiangensis TaxID=512350 RepID=A0A316FD11_9ACTN|nr:hypothetical protein BC793_11136 [Actinoplanes xinjiangensis]GIF41599.1 hypothetical protein Axi01nite_59100 [Actinoplanes xinjiangensis]
MTIGCIRRNAGDDRQQDDGREGGEYSVLNIRAERAETLVGDVVCAGAVHDGVRDLCVIDKELRSGVGSPDRRIRRHHSSAVNYRPPSLATTGANVSAKSAPMTK